MAKAIAKGKGDQSNGDSCEKVPHEHTFRIGPKTEHRFRQPIVHDYFSNVVVADAPLLSRSKEMGVSHARVGSFHNM